MTRLDRGNRAVTKRGKPTWLPAPEDRLTRDDVDRLFALYNIILESDPDWREVEAMQQQLDERARPIKQRAMETFRKAARTVIRDA